MTDAQNEIPLSLRRRAEEIAQLDEATALKTLSLEDAQQLFHELRVYQIELEIQNEELRRTQHELELSRVRYFSLYDLAPAGYLTLNKQGLIKEANLAVASMLGMAQNDLLKKPISNFIYREDQDLYYLHRKKVFAAGNAVQVWEMRMLRAGGSFFWARLHATPGQNDEYWVTLNDITERKLAEQVLQAYLKISNYASGHSLDALLSKFLDEAELLTDSQIAFFHLVDTDQISLTLQAWSAKTVSQFCSSQGKGMHYPLDRAGVWGDCVRKRKPLMHNDYPSLPDRKELPPGHAPVLRELVVPIIRNDLVVAVLGVGNKITDYTDQQLRFLRYLANLTWDIVIRKLAELELQQSKEAAEAANRAKSDFLATMSHEIRTPLGAMLGNIELLEGSALTPPQQECLKDCKYASQMLLQVINDVLDFSKIEAGKLELVNETFSVTSMARQLVRIFSTDARQKGLELSVSLADDLPEYIFGDEQRLRQILANLINNALKFTSHGTVSLKIASVQPPSAADPDKAVLCIEVRDTGIGIAADMQEHIFERFTQVGGFSTRSASGTGLGLPICRRLLAMMGGSITVSSVPGEGSVFTIDLPVTVAPPQVQSQAQEQEQAQIKACPRKVLIADDDDRGRAVAQKLLQRRGYTVTAVENGARLLDALQAEKFDIVLTDISMPDMVGTQVACIIRSGDRIGIDPHIPIIAITAHAYADDRKKFLDAGINGCIAKPVNIEELFRQIEELCNRSRE